MPTTENQFVETQLKGHQHLHVSYQLNGKTILMFTCDQDVLEGKRLAESFDTYCTAHQ